MLQCVINSALVVNKGNKVAQEPKISLQYHQSSVKAATQHYTPPMASHTPEIRGGFSRHDAIDLTLDDSDDAMTAASTFKTVDNTIMSSASLKSSVGSAGFAKCLSGVIIPLHHGLTSILQYLLLWRLQLPQCLLLFPSAILGNFNWSRRNLHHL